MSPSDDTLAQKLRQHPMRVQDMLGQYQKGANVEPGFARGLRGLCNQTLRGHARI